MIRPKRTLQRSLQCLILFGLLFPPAAALAQTESPGDILTQPALGVQKVLFIRVNYPDDDTVILSDERAPIHANAYKDIYETNSYNTLSFDVDVTPVLTMPQPSSFYQLENRLSFVRIRADAIKIAGDAGFHENDYDRDAIFTKRLWVQDVRGIAGFNFRTFFLSEDLPLITAHETGHTFGWRHASFWQAAGANPLAPEGKLYEYGDPFDIMGDASVFHHFNPWLKFRVGWLPPESILTVSESGTYIVRALEKPPLSGPSVDEYSALRIRRSPDTEYWVFYRSGEEPANAGATIIQVKPSNTSRSLLLDMTPGSRLLGRDADDAALTVGKTIRDEEAGIEIKVLGKNDDSLAVQVVVPDALVDRVPVLDIVSPEFGKTVRGAVDYEATAFDPDLGAVNGAGIDTVKFILGYDAGTDPNGNDNVFVMQGEKALTAPPYIFHVETADLPDEAYRLTVTAVSQNGGVNRAAFRHIIDNTGPSAPTLVAGEQEGAARFFQLQQNYPNPFNSSTQILYTLPHAGSVEAAVYDSAGRTIRTLVNEFQTAGQKSVVWDGRDDGGTAVSSGVYFLQVRGGAFRGVKKMSLVQ